MEKIQLRIDEQRRIDKQPHGGSRSEGLSTLSLVQLFGNILEIMQSQI